MKTVYGYRGINNELTILDKEANVVKWILREYLRGRTLKQIKGLLEDFNIKSPSGGDKWDCKTMNNLLPNEKYIGNVFQQKTFVSDALTGKRETDIGQIKKVYIENNHNLKGIF